MWIFQILHICYFCHDFITQLTSQYPLLSFPPCQSCPCPGLEGRWSLRCPAKGSAADSPLSPSFQRAFSSDLHFWSVSAKKKEKNHHLDQRRHIKAKFESFWKKISLCTTELRLAIPSACRPISASLLASSTLLTPQLGATLPLQRMWTFILQTGERNHTDEKTC